MENAAIEVRQAVKRFGEVLAVDAVSLSVRQGEILGLIGHNGAGKSTLFKLMLGLLQPTSGTILIAGCDVTGPGFREIRRGIGYLPENIVLYDNLTGLETLRFFADLKGVGATQCAAALERVGLLASATRRVRGYSKGMRQRLGFAQALLGQPRLLFLDEPTNGLDPEGIRDFYRILDQLRAQGVTVVLSSHVLAEIEARVDRLAIMRAGRIQALGTVQELREALDLPLWLHVTPRNGAAQALESRLAGLGLNGLYGKGEVISVRLPRELKMQALEALAAHPGEIADLQIREPSLEDVFLGCAENGAAAPPSTEASS